MVEVVSEPSSPAEPVKGKDVAVQRHNHPIFKSVDDGDMERLQNFLEVEAVSVEMFYLSFNFVSMRFIVPLTLFE